MFFCSVSLRHINSLPILTPDYKSGVIGIMCFQHIIVNHYLFIDRNCYLLNEVYHLFGRGKGLL